MSNAEQRASWTSILAEASREGVVIRPGCEPLRSAGLDRLPIPAAALRSALLSPDSHSRGTLSIRKMAVAGHLDLSHIQWPGWLSIEESIVAGRLDFFGSNFGGVQLRNTTAECINAERMVVAGSFLAAGLTAENIRLRDARVEGSLQLRAAQLRETANGPSIELDGAQVRGTLDLSSISAPHGVRAADARVASAMDLSHSNLGNHVGVGLDTTGTRIEGDLILAACFVNGSVLSHRLGVGGIIRSSGLNAIEWKIDGARIVGGLDLRHGNLSTGFEARNSELGMQFDLSGASLGSGDGIALGVEDCTISGALLLSDTSIKGRVSLTRSRVSGPLIAQRAIISSSSGISISLDAAKLSSVLLSECVVEGQVSAIEVSCDAAMALTGTTVEALGAAALQFDGAVIKGDLDLTGLVARGQVCIAGCSVGGQLSAAGSSVAHDGGPALLMDGAHVKRDVLLTNTYLGSFLSAKTIECAGRLELCGMQISTMHELGITLYGSVIEQGVDARSLTCAGAIDMQRTTVNGGLILGNTSSTAKPSLTLAQANLDSLDMRIASAKQFLDLRGSHLGVILVTDGALHDWYPLWDATGVKVDDVRGGSSKSVRRYTEWLDTIPKDVFSAQPWQELAGWLERNGDPSGAKRFRFAAARRVTRSMPLWAKPIRWLYAVAAGYGYYPLVAVFWFILLWLGAFLLVSGTPAGFLPTSQLPAGATAIHPTGMTPCQELGGYPCFDAVAYTNGVVSPVGWLHPSPWSPTNSAYAYVMWAASAIRTMGWALSAVLLAGISGLLKKG